MDALKRTTPDVSREAEFSRNSKGIILYDTHHHKDVAPQAAPFKSTHLVDLVFTGNNRPKADAS